MKVYQALYNPCIYDSGYITLSIHLSEEGAEKAIEQHKEQQYKEWKEIYPDTKDENFEFGEWERWETKEIEILP